MNRFKEFLKREWSAWRRMQDERRRHEEECISVPLVRYCELLQAEERAKILAVNLAVEHKRLVCEQRLSEVLGAMVFHMTEDLCANDLCASAPQDVARLELVPPVEKGFDA